MPPASLRSPDQFGLSARDLLVMEASGGNERRAQWHLSERGLRGAIVNAARVRDFARASGRLAKTGRVNEAVIARYGAFARPAPTPLATGARQTLAELLAYRRQLTAEITARGQQLSHPTLRAVYERLLKNVKPPKLALVVLMRKMLVALNAMLRTITPWRQPSAAASTDGC
jgi:transposase